MGIRGLWRGQGNLHFSVSGTENHRFGTKHNSEHKAFEAQGWNYFRNNWTGFKCLLQYWHSINWTGIQLALNLEVKFCDVEGRVD